ncbi:MAG: DAK2 domain-containing protein, partial [Clostridiales bacterium]
MKLKEMGAAQLGEFLHSGCDNLCALKEEVNALNVFPVPDGDTGINMYLTIASAVKNIDDQAKNPDVGKMAYNFSLGALMGARGNSGVILSQIFRGFSQSIGNKKTINAHDFAVALQKGVNLSYKSVMKPREGTILTVFKDFAAAANTYAEKDDDIIAMLRYALEEGDKSLENTPNLLPVLKQAGVVDA